MSDSPTEPNDVDSAAPGPRSDPGSDPGHGYEPSTETVANTVPRKRFSIFRLFGLLMLVAVLLGVGVAALGYQEFESFKQRRLALPDDAADRVYLVEKGAHIRGIARDLLQRGWLRAEHEKYLFELVGRESGLAHRLKVGEFEIPADATAAVFLRVLAEGKTVEYSVTLIEGWRFRDMLNAVAAHPKLEQTLTGKTDAEIMAAIGAKGLHPEGRFYPDTYLFPRGTTDVAFLKRAFRKMEDVLAAEWPNRAPNLPLKTPYEALILASIVEKETGAAHERPQIAGVFIRRLNKRMRLQTDPTVIYGMGENFDGNIRRKDLRTDTPYNTYTRHGLPPTPIALPGGDAIRAALHPASGKTLYFVAKGDGTHYFSVTLKEHNAAVRKYQLRR